MVNFTSKLRLRSSVAAVGEARDGIVFVDNNYRIYKVDKKSGEFVFVKKIFKDAPPLHEYTKQADAGDNKVLMPKLRSRVDNLLKTEGSKISMLQNLTWHKGYVTVSKISPDFEYLATGGEDGRSYVYNNSNYTLHAILPPCPDYISCISFSQNSKLIAYCSYKPQIIVYSLEDGKVVLNHELQEVAEDCEFYEDDKKVFFVCRNGDTGTYDTETSKVDVKRNYKSWLNCIEMNYDRNYAYVCAREGVLYLHRLRDNSQAHRFELPVNGVNKVKQISNMIYLCCTDGNVLVMDPAKHITEFMELYKAGDFRAMYDFANENNILLKTLKVYEDMRMRLWPGVLQEAVKEVNSGNLQRAIDIVSCFVEDPKIDMEFKSFMRNKARIKEAIECIEHKNFKRVYEIVKEEPALGQLSFIKKVDEEFDRLYDMAKGLLVKDHSVNLDKARKLLEPFAGVPHKKVQIDDMLNNAGEFVQAERLVREKNFKGLFDLCKRHAFLEKSKSYLVAYQLCTELFDKVVSKVFSTEGKRQGGGGGGGEDECEKVLGYLATLGPFAGRAKDLIEILSLRKQFLQALGKKDYKGCYDLINNNKELQGMQEVLDLNDDINKLLNECAQRAHEGDPQAIHKTIGPIFRVEKWKNRTRDVMKISFLYELEKAKAKQYEDIEWAGTFKNYMKLFGKDNEIISFCSDENLKSVIDSSDHDKDESLDIPSRIIVYKETAQI